MCLVSTGQAVNASNSIVAPTFPIESGALSTLTFSNMFVSQAGLYTCRGNVFSSLFGSTVLEDTAQLVIQSK